MNFNSLCEGQKGHNTGQKGHNTGQKGLLKAKRAKTRPFRTKGWKEHLFGSVFSLFARARGKSMESFIQPFKYLRDVHNDHKIHETLRKLVTDNLLKLGQEENQQSVLRSVTKHASLLDI